MDSLPVQVCTKCGDSKPATPEYFHEAKSGKYGLRGECKLCRKVKGKAYYEANKEAHAVYMKAWAKVNAEDKKSKAKTYREKNKERRAEYNRVWYRDNKELQALRGKLWQKANPEKVSERRQKRRSRAIGAKGSFAADDLVKQFDAQKGKCWWCGCKLIKSGKGRFHADHVIALAKGGSNNPENIVCACPTCNYSKQDKTPLEFAGRLF